MNPNDFAAATAAHQQQLQSQHQLQTQQQQQQQQQQHQHHHQEHASQQQAAAVRAAANLYGSHPGNHLAMSAFMSPQLSQFAAAAAAVAAANPWLAGAAPPLAPQPPAPTTSRLHQNGYQPLQAYSQQVPASPAPFGRPLYSAYDIASLSAYLAAAEAGSASSATPLGHPVAPGTHAHHQSHHEQQAAAVAYSYLQAAAAAAAVAKPNPYHSYLHNPFPQSPGSHAHFAPTVAGSHQQQAAAQHFLRPIPQPLAAPVGQQQAPPQPPPPPPRLPQLPALPAAPLPPEALHQQRSSMQAPAPACPPHAPAHNQQHQIRQPKVSGGEEYHQAHNRTGYPQQQQQSHDELGTFRALMQPDLTLDLNMTRTASRLLQQSHESVLTSAKSSSRPHSPPHKPTSGATTTYKLIMPGIPGPGHKPAGRQAHQDEEPPVLEQRQMPGPGRKTARAGAWEPKQNRKSAYRLSPLSPSQQQPVSKRLKQQPISAVTQQQQQHAVQLALGSGARHGQAAAGSQKRVSTVGGPGRRMCAAQRELLESQPERPLDCEQLDEDDDDGSVIEIPNFNSESNSARLGPAPFPGPISGRGFDSAPHMGDDFHPFRSQFGANPRAASTAGNATAPIAQPNPRSYSMESSTANRQHMNLAQRLAQGSHHAQIPQANSEPPQPVPKGRPPDGFQHQQAAKSQQQVAPAPTGSAGLKQNLQQQQQQIQVALDSLKCFTCLERLEDRHFVQCPTVQKHKFCFACSKISIKRQRYEANRKLVGKPPGGGEKPGSASSSPSPSKQHPDQLTADSIGAIPIFCPSGQRCFLANDQNPWTFMNNEIETIFRESSRTPTASAAPTPPNNNTILHQQLTNSTSVAR